MEPSPAELRELSTIGAIMDWCLFPAPLREAFAASMGLEPTNPARLLAAIREADVLTAIGSMRVGDNPITPAARGMVETAWRVSQLFTGAVKTQLAIADEETAKKLQEERKLELLKAQLEVAKSTAVDATPKPASSGVKTFNLSEVIDQMLSGTAELISKEEEDELHAVFEERTEGPCHKAERPTIMQLSAFKCLLLADLSVYADFAIFGPHGNRIYKKLVMAGLIPAGVGEFRRVELRGPPNITVWTACFMVMRSAYIMWRIASMNALDRYLHKIWQLHRDYGSAVWHLLYQAEARMRSEELPEIQRTLVREKRVVEAAKGVHPFNPERPWAEAWVRATSERSDKFWNDEFVVPATLVRLRLKSLGQVVDGDLPVGDEKSDANLTKDTVNSSRGAAMVAPHPGPPAPAPPAGGQRRVQTGTARWTTNKKRNSLCPGFQNGTCHSSVPGDAQCPHDRNLRHQCNICLGTHTPAHCDGSGPGAAGPPAPGNGRGQGRGKGRGRGSRGTGKGRAPWQQ